MRTLVVTGLLGPRKLPAEILEAAEDCPDPWESCYVPPPDEPVTGMREVPRDILDWEYP